MVCAVSNDFGICVLLCLLQLTKCLNKLSPFVESFQKTVHSLQVWLHAKQ